jgi:serine/threonine protein kinase
MNYFCQMVEVVKLMHSKNCAHRDLKPVNFLIIHGNKEKNIRDKLLLADFGLAKTLEHS